MITINTVSASKFSYNGINYFKNFMPFVYGNKISILNTYDACISLTTAPTHFSEYVVNGITYTSVADLQDALLPVLFIKGGLSSSEWGTIGGSISAQTDLQTALNAKQPSSADLSSIAGLTGTSGLLRKTAANTYSLDTNSYALDSGVVKLTGTQTIGGSKTFENGTRFDSDLHLKQDNIISTPSGYTTFSGNSNGFWFHNGASRQAIFSLANTSTLRTYELPDADGVFALTSNLSSYLPLSGGTLASSGSANTLNINHSSGSGVAASITKGGNGEALTVVKSSGSGNAASITGGVTLLSELNLTTKLADAHINSAATWNAKQNALVSGTNIKTINGNSLLGSGDLVISGGGSTEPLEFNVTERTVWNNGNGNIASNTSFGSGALKSNTTGQNCTAFGNVALFSSTTAAGNTAIGAAALSFITTSAGSYNTALGLNAGSVLSNGAGNINSNNCVFIGRNTSPLYDGNIPTNEIVIGDSTTGHGSNTVTLGNSSIVTTILRGIVNINASSASLPTPPNGLSLYTGANVGVINSYNSSGAVADLYLGASKVLITYLGTGTVYSNAGFLTNTNPSDERLKENIDDLGYGLAEILQLRPVTYNWINDTANQGKQFGFIAQEVQEIMPDLINEFTITEDEEEVVRLGLDKEAIFVAMVNAIKELKAEIEILKQ